MIPGKIVCAIKFSIPGRSKQRNYAVTYRNAYIHHKFIPHSYENIPVRSNAGNTTYNQSLHNQQMQTILGANGQIAEELARELHKNFTTELRLVSRNPKKINNSDQLFAANLMDPEATAKAVAGSEIVYLTVGLPMNSAMWSAQFPVMMKNVI